MSDFTEQQELEIINSFEFARFLEERRAAGSDRIGIDDFLEIAGNQAKWEKRFADRENQNNKPELTLEEIKQYLGALETTTDSTNDSALDEYFENLQKDGHDTLNSVVNGEWVLAEDTYNTPEAYETTKKFIEDMVGGYTTSLGGQNNDVNLKDVYDRALAMLEAARTAYENGNQETKDNDKQDEQKQETQLLEDKEGDLEYLDLTEEERDTLREQYKGKEDVLDYIRRMNPTERDEASAIDQYLMEFWRGKRVAVTEEKQENEELTIDEPKNDEGEKKNEEELQEIPNLVHVLTHTGFNNRAIADSLAEQLQSPNLDDKERAILEAVHKAYTTPNHEGLTTLNDLIKDTRDVEIAENVARTFGFESAQEWPVTQKHIEKYIPEPQPVQTHTEERDVPNMLMVVTDNREAGANHTVAELMTQLDNINAANHNLDADRLKRMVLAIKQSQGELSNQDVLDSFASTDFQEIYNNVQNMPAEERDRRLETAGFRNFENKINGEDSTFARDRLLALYMLSEARKYTDTKYSLNNIIQNEADVKIGDFIAKNVYGYDDPVNPTSNGVREPYFTRKMTIEVVGGEATPAPQPINDTIVIDAPEKGNEEIHEKPVEDVHGGDDNGDKITPHPPVIENPIEEENDDVYRKRSRNSDENAFLEDKLKLKVLLDMNIIDQALYDAGLQTPAHAIEALDKKRSLTDKEKIEFQKRLTTLMLDNNEILEQLRPQLLAQKYNELKESIEATKKQNENANTQTEEEQLGRVTKQIDHLIDEYYQGTQTLALDMYSFDDHTNIADIYDGYIDMLDARQPDADDSLKGKIDVVRGKLDNDIGIYDKTWNLDGISADDLSRMSDNQERLSKQLDNIELDEETYKWLNNVHFKTETGSEYPRFCNVQGTIISQWVPGARIVPNSRLADFVTFAKNNTLIQHLADKDNVSAEDLQRDLQDQLKIQIFSLSNVQDTLNGIAEEKDKFTDPKYQQEFFAKLSNADRPLDISDEAYKASIQSSVNNTIACINRVGAKTLNDSPLLGKLYEPISKFDDRKRERFSENDKRKVKWWKTFAYTTASSLASKAVSFGVFKGSAALSATTGWSAWSLSASAGVAAVGLTATGMILNYKNYKKDMKAKGEKASFGNFLVRKPYRSQNIASAIGFTAGAFLVTGQPELAAIAGVAALGVMGYSTYNSARETGVSKKEAAKQTLKRVSAMAAGALTGSYLGSLLGMTPPTKTEAERIGTTPDKEGYTTHDYTSDEHSWAEGRNSDPRWSEFLEKYHVAKDLQDPGNPNMVSSDAMTNLKASITQAIGDNKIFYTDTGDGNLVPNTEMLAYKATQLLYLAPDPNATIQTGEFAGQSIGTVLGYNNPDGTHVNYVEAIQQAVSTGKIDNPQGFAEMLIKTENAIGGQIDPTTNDMGKITLFGTGPEAHPVQSYNANADAGYDINPHAAEPGQASMSEQKTIPGNKIWGLGYWEPVRDAGRKLQKQLGGLADRLFKNKKKEATQNAPLPPVPPIPNEKKEPDSEKKTSMPLQETPQTTLNEMLDKEYQIVHGIKPSEAERARYKQLVQNEWQQESTPPADMAAYMQQRMDTFETMIGTAKEPLAESNQGLSDKYKDDINKAREVMWKLPQGERGTADVTLTGFRQHMAKCLSNDGQLRAEVSSKNYDSTKTSVGKIRKEASSR